MLDDDAFAEDFCLLRRIEFATVTYERSFVNLKKMKAHLVHLEQARVDLGPVHHAGSDGM